CHGQLSESLDAPQTYEIAAQSQAPTIDHDQGEQDDFLSYYRSQLAPCLDQAITEVMGDRLSSLKRKKPQMVQPFLMAMHLFHCGGYSMGEIAPLIGLKAQFQVTRLLKLKELRATVQARMITLLLDRVVDQAKHHLDIDHLDTGQLDRISDQIRDALNDDVVALMYASEAEATTVKHRPLTSMFAQCLCSYLETRSLAS
ncbi:MAG: hypothetical protein F6K09_05845, partial [Merismopedia sp. SIO2A8]|nr:hypothetical protein [Merismopedia sp. SIO2A8]